ncbi:MAG: twin-arginine translocase TatA/TatE family subunit [Thermodesulfobacteriota bacterium]|nr:twin-arginine translocase TatA/TatE family subunit [Thermodesulfobacteriota bacterium]
MFGLGATELIIIAAIILLIFGSKKLPDIGKGLGGAIREFRDVKKDVKSDNKEHVVEKKTEEKKTLNDKITEKVLNDIPVVKKGMDIKKKADAIKKLLK